MKAALALAIALLAAQPAAAQELCAAAGKPEMPKPRPGTTAVDPCDALAALAKVVGVCAAELPNDRAMQVHAAGLLELEREHRIQSMVLAGMRTRQTDPGTNPKGDPAIIAKQVATAEAGLAKIEAGLADRRRAAIAGGYARFGEAGFAQTVISNAVWRHLQPEVARALAACTRDEAGKREAREIGAGLAVMASHGNAFEREVLRRIREGK